MKSSRSTKIVSWAIIITFLFGIVATALVAIFTPEHTEKTAEITQQ